MTAAPRWDWWGQRVTTLQQSGREEGDSGAGVKVAHRRCGTHLYGFIVKRCEWVGIQKSSFYLPFQWRRGLVVV